MVNIEQSPAVIFTHFFKFIMGSKTSQCWVLKYYDHQLSIYHLSRKIQSN